MYFEFARCGHGVKEQARAGMDLRTVVLVDVVPTTQIAMRDHMLGV
jgi:hypothetical protein